MQMQELSLFHYKLLIEEQKKKSLKKAIKRNFTAKLKMKHYLFI